MLVSPEKWTYNTAVQHSTGLELHTNPGQATIWTLALQASTKKVVGAIPLNAEMLHNVSPASWELLVVQLSLMKHENKATFLPGAWRVHKQTHPEP
eukprot:1161269-Pelagomonas_calceolata.AAC.14